VSRSYSKNISFGKSKSGKSNRGSRNWLVKRNELGKVSRKTHWLSKMQNFEQFVSYVRNHCMADESLPNLTHYSHDKFDRKNWKDYEAFLDGRQETKELIEEFAKILYNKHRSK
jgi:hypothetical protein